MHVASTSNPSSRSTSSDTSATLAALWYRPSSYSLPSRAASSPAYARASCGLAASSCCITSLITPYIAALIATRPATWSRLACEAGWAAAAPGGDTSGAVCAAFLVTSDSAGGY